MPPRSRDLIAALAEPVDVETLLATWQTFARPTQLRPPECLRVWHVRAGRGWGKDRAGAEYTLDLCEDWGPALRGLIVSRTADEVLEVMLRGVSGLNACARRRGYELDFEPSRGPSGTVVHPSGAELRLGSGDVLDGVRGPNLNYVWGDEVASWRYGAEVVASIDFALRAPAPAPGPHALYTGTPSHTSRVRFDPEVTTLTSGHMAENRDNLAPSVVRDLERRYAGSKLGRQELFGEVVGVDGAIVDLDLIHEHRVRDVDWDKLHRCTIGVDPAVAGRIDRDAIGIIVVAMDEDGHLYVLEDCTVPGCAPEAWGRAVWDAYDRWDAGVCVYEKNQGGVLIEHPIRAAAAGRPINLEGVSVQGNKRDRLDRILAPLYKQGRIHHLNVHEALERELSEYSGRGKSPDHADALCLAVQYLIGNGDGHSEGIAPAASDRLMFTLSTRW